MKSIEVTLNHLTIWIMKLFSAESIFAATICAIAGFFIELRPFFIVAMLAITIDFITGVLAAYVNYLRLKEKGAKITKDDRVTSTRMWGTVLKFLVVFMAICMAKSIETNLFAGIPITHGVTGIIVFAEVKSFAENFEVITGYDIFFYFNSIIPSRFKQPK